MATIEIGETTPKKNNKKPKDSDKGGKKIGFLLQGLFIGFFTGVLLFSLYKLGTIFLEYHSGEAEYEDLQQYVLEEPTQPEDSGTTDMSLTDIRTSRIDLSALQEINEEAVGWITIPDTEINYPIVHTTDNSFYLTHTFSKENNKSGGIFIDAANNADLSDLHTLIYGHNMKNGSMFGGLKSYKQESYWKDHPYIYIDLADGSHCYEIFSSYVALVTDICYTIDYVKDDYYASFLEALQESSLYDTGVEVGIDDLVITLSTCTNQGKDRFVVHAKKIY